MTKSELYYKLTGTETPRFITEREECIIVTCLSLINDIEAELNHKNKKQTNGHEQQGND